MDFHGHLTLNSEHSIIICAHHHYCIKPNGVLSHFASLHSKNTTTEERRKLQRLVDTISFSLHQDYDDFEIPPLPIPAIPGLTVHYDALKCNKCGYIRAGSTALENIKGHIRECVGLGAADADVRGRQEIKAWWATYFTPTYSQQFFTKASGKANHVVAHFEVTETAVSPSQTLSLDEAIHLSYEVSTTHTNDILDPTLSTLDRLQAQFAEAEQKGQEEEELELSLVPQAGTRQTMPYLEHTKFQECLAGLTWERVRAYVRSTKKEVELKFLEKTVKSMILVYQHTVTRTSRWARIRVMQESMNHIPTTPLFPYLEFDLHHGQCLVKIFAFFYNIFTNGFERPKTLHLQPRQGAAFGAILELLSSYDSEFPNISLEHTRFELNPLEALCHQFWLSLVEQTTMYTDFHLALITPLAFIAADPNTDNFRPAYLFATDISALKKLIRFAGCQKMWDTIAPAHQDLISEHESTEGTTLEEAATIIIEQDEAKQWQTDSEERARAGNDAFRKWVYDYLTEEYQTPMHWLITTARYISKFRYGETLDAFVRWNGSTVQCKHIATNFNDYTSMVWSLYHEIEKKIVNLSFAEKLGDLPAIPWASIECDPTNQVPKYSPFSPKEKALLSGRSFVVQHMLAAITSKTHKKLTILDLDNCNHIQRYCNELQEFLQLLFFACLCTSGQPFRLTELASLLCENTVSNGIRNIFLYQGYLALLPRYSKGYNRNKTIKMVYRYLPRQVGSYLIWYLWLLRPFYQTLTQRQPLAQRDVHYYQSHSSFIWSNSLGKQHKTSAMFATIVKRATERWMGQEITPNLFRHLLIAFGRKLDKKGDGPLQVLTPEEVDEVVEEAEDNARETQAGHSLTTATAVYALTTASVFRNKFAAPDAHLKVSQTWHEALRFDPVDEGVKQNPSTAELYARSTHILDLSNINVSWLLRENFGPEAKFRGFQREVIEEVFGCEPAVAHIAPTGKGKSTAFILPACCVEYGQTIVITPLVALRTDLTQRCKELSLTTSTYGSSGFNEAARIIFAMPEHLAYDGFTRMVARRRDLRKLERIVVDEFHYVLLPDSKYRPHLLLLRDLVQHVIPLTLLSATIPISLQEEAYKLMHIEGTVRTFRESTSRPNIKYEVVTLPHRNPVTTKDMCTYIQDQEAQFTKIVVYVASAKEAIAISEILQCDAYYGDLDEAARTEIQHAFKDCLHGTLVATAAFNSGVNIHNIRLVLRMGKPDNLITSAQEGGRAGRDGLPCVVRVVLGKGIFSWFDKADIAARRVIEEFLQENVRRKVCRRIALDRYFDANGHTRQFCQTTEEACDVCEDRVLNSRGIGQLSISNTNHGASPIDPASPSTSTLKSNSGSFLTQNNRIAYATPARPTLYKPQSSKRNHPPWLGESTPSQNLPTTEDGYTTSNAATTREPTRLAFPHSPSLRHGVPQGETSTPVSLKRHRHQVSTSDQPTSPPSSTSRHAMKSARIDRQLDFGRETLLAESKENADIMKQVEEMAQYWTNNCIACFAIREPFDHPKAGCANHSSDLANHYRMTKLKNRLGTPQCWSCFLPNDLCGKWRGRESKCTYPHVTPDTWATLWEYCPKVRDLWGKKIVASDSKLDGNKDEDFATYFRVVIDLGSRKHVSRIAYETTLITTCYFLGPTPRFKELQNDNTSLSPIEN